MSDIKAVHTELLSLTADIVSSHFANNTVSLVDVPAVIERVYATLAGLGTAVVEEAPKQEPAVSIRSSIKPDFIVCLEDGKKFKMLKRHLMKRYSLTPDQYRAKWNLPADYPMVAPNYVEQRRMLAKAIGLGTRRTVPPKGKPRGRPRKVAA